MLSVAFLGARRMEAEGQEQKRKDRFSKNPMSVSEAILRKIMLDKVGQTILKKKIEDKKQTP